MSSGLVASMALPAQAVGSTQEAVSGPATASIPAVPASLAGEALYTAPEGGLLALPPDLAIDDTALAAPAAATVDFDRSSFTVGTHDDNPGTDENADEGDDTPVSAPAPTTRKQGRQAQTAPSSSNDTADTATKATPKLAPKSSTARGSKVIAIAYRYIDTPYVFGGMSPRGFDCSGYTKYVYNQLGVNLGRTVSDQRGNVTFVHRSKAVPGDLVFFGSSHVGIYIGGNMMIDAPRRGKTIQPRKIYSANVSFGRVAV